MATSTNIGVKRNNCFSAKRLLGFLSTMIAATLVCGPVSANGYYFGAKTGPMYMDETGIDSPTNIGLVVGYEVGVLLGDLGLEGEMTTTTKKGEFDGEDVDIDTAALYLALRSAGPIYVKGRAGYLTEEVTIGKATSSESGPSASFGIGFGIGIMQFELDYTVIEDDISFLSLGVQF